jgi:hypothetical protein
MLEWLGSHWFQLIVILELLPVPFLAGSLRSTFAESTKEHTAVTTMQLNDIINGLREIEDSLLKLKMPNHHEEFSHANRSLDKLLDEMRDAQKALEAIYFNTKSR